MFDIIYLKYLENKKNLQFDMYKNSDLYVRKLSSIEKYTFKLNQYYTFEYQILKKTSLK